MVETILASTILGISLGVASRISVIKSAKVLFNKERQKHIDIKLELEASSAEKLGEMQLFVDGLIDQLSTERLINSEYINDLEYLSQKLNLEQELSKELYDALLLQEPKVKRQHDSYNKAKAFYKQVHSD